MSLESKIVDALREAVPPLALGAVVAFLGATVYALARHWWGAAAVTAVAAVIPGWIVIDWWRDHLRRPTAGDG
jgi:hypothetical protein